jgi:hypothetical protein
MQRLMRVILILGLASTFLISIGQSSWASPTDCIGTKTKVNDVHWSSTVKSIVVKGQVTCSTNVDYVNPWVELYFCGDRYPQKDKTWLTNNCGPFWTSKGGVVWYMPARKTRTLRAPEDAQLPARLDGYYVGLMFYVARDAGVSYTSPWLFSKVARCTATATTGSCTQFL